MNDGDRREVAARLAAVAWLVGCSCGGHSTAPDPAAACGGYPEWQTSAYVLPYAVGTARYVMQGNCTSPREDSWNSHQESGPWAFAYDFLMPIGTPVVAARGGSIVYVEERFADGDTAHNNAIVVAHDDGTFAGYGHLARNGALAQVGQIVAQGEAIALSGMSGPTDTPHLHFQVSPCTEMDTLACKSVPVTFRNTDPNPSGLVRGRTYEALPYG